MINETYLKKKWIRKISSTAIWNVYTFGFIVENNADVVIFYHTMIILSNIHRLTTPEINYGFLNGQVAT